MHCCMQSVHHALMAGVMQQRQAQLHARQECGLYQHLVLVIASPQRCASLPDRLHRVSAAQPWTARPKKSVHRHLGRQKAAVQALDIAWVEESDTGREIQAAEWTFS